MQNQIQPKIQIVDNQVITSSLDVTEFFEKRHDDVLKAIRNIIKKDAEWGLRNFAECEIIRDIPLQGEKAMPSFTMTRDGFTMLAMSFTGEKAFKFKLAYIQAFNAMEAELLPKRKQLDATSTKEDRKPLTTLISTLVSVAPISYRDVWHMVKAELKTCKSASEFTVSEVFIALTFVQSKIDLYCFEANKDDVSKAFVSKVELAALSILRAVDREEAQRYLNYRNALTLSRQQVSL